jgi:hypothetical protein
VLVKLEDDDGDHGNPILLAEKEDEDFKVLPAPKNTKSEEAAIRRDHGGSSSIQKPK